MNSNLQVQEYNELSTLLIENHILENFVCRIYQIPF